MNTGIADRFLDVFSRYIDSGFGLLGGEVAFLAGTLVAIDVTLAALFWTWSVGDDIVARLVKKTLYVGFFAFLLSNFNGLARILFESFSGLGLKAAGGSFSASDFLHPGKLAQSGIDAGRPLLEAAQQMCGFPAFFDNFPKIIVLLVGWMVVLVAFFVLAVQLFVTLLEFKLTTLAGFVLVPFGLFGKTAFLAERVLGNVMASGVKVLVLAVIVGIGSTLFSAFVQDFGGQQPDLEQVLSLALGALCLLGLGIFGPTIANGLVSGGPQLGAGAAVGAGLAAGGLVAGGALGARAALGAGVGGARTVISKIGGSRPGPTGSDDSGLRPPPPTGGGSPSSGGSAASPGAGAPAWARQYRRRQEAAHAAGVATHALRAGDHPGGGTSVSLAEDRP